MTGREGNRRGTGRRAPGIGAADGPVAIQGVAGAFSHLAARRIYGPEVLLRPCATFDELFEAVTGGTAAAGVVPVENTLAGAVQRPLDLLVGAEVRAVAEATVPVRLCLVGRPGSTLADIRSAASHPVALEQCHGFFRAHPSIQRHTAWDTAGSVREAVAGSADYEAGVGSELAAEVYGGVVLARDIQDHATNRTRFLAVMRGAYRRDDGPAPAPKTSLAFTTVHRPGALHAVLGVFADAALDLTRLESRPIPDRPWEYRFHADVRGGTAEEQDGALERLRHLVTHLKVIGRYGAEGSPEPPPQPSEDASDRMQE